mgnify:FL=1
MIDKSILKIAMEQSAIDASCRASDFTRSDNVIVESKSSPRARKYLQLPFICNLISYGTNIVASIGMQYKDIVETYINKYSVAQCFETPSLQVINEAFKKHNMQVCFMAEYFLPDINEIPDLHCNYELRILRQKDFTTLYVPQWANALCEKRKNLDVLGIGAYHNHNLIGLAACSADCETMWQIGVDVIPEMRRQGIASALTSRLAIEILNHGKVPFYCCAWSNIKSVRNAIKSGFRPAWVEMTIKSDGFVNELNNI